MNAPTTEALTASDLLGDAAARLDRLCAADLAPGSALYELWRIAALHQAALRETVAPATETDRARNAMIAQALHEYADRLDAVPLDCTALTGPLWYGQGWRDAVNHLRDLADGLMPAPQHTGGGDVGA